VIDKRDILELASTLGLLPSVVEKDYVLGWILAGINAHPDISDSWVFKGGTCLKKCYFETYRFSEDLDFTLREQSHIDELFLKKTLGEVAIWVSEQSGLSMPVEHIGLDLFTNPRGRLACQAKMGYRGPVSPSGGGWPKIKLDLTADEKLVLPHVEREVFHPYADRPDDGIWISCYAYEEAFAEKVRALGERTRPRDLYDVVNLYRHTDSRPSASVLLDVLRQKCAYKAVPVPTVAALSSHRDTLESTWENMLAHQLPALPPLADFWEALPDIFNWITGTAAIPQRTYIQQAAGEVAIRSRVLPMAIPIRSRSALEIIRFAAANHLCVDLTYDGSVRRIEPYSLRQTAEGNYVIHAIRTNSGEHRSYRVDRIYGATVTSEVFSPRYTVEITSAGPLPVVASSATPRVSRISRTLRSSRGPRYVYRCSYCRKTFSRQRMDGSLNAHKTPQGYPCPSRTGIYVRTKYSS
jgi:predicted nucleotidyltransferase component of viral defense system